MTQTHNDMIKVIRNSRLNKVSFFQNGNQVYPIHTSGNIYEFADGQLVLV